MTSNSSNQTVFNNVPDRQHERHRTNQQYQFSSEELRTIKECNNEAIFYRGIPTGTISSAVTYYALSRGYLTASPTYGFMPKILFAAVSGYFLGKVSYQTVCADRLMKLPDGRFAEYVKRMKENSSNPSFAFPDKSSVESDVFNQVPDKPIFDDHKPDERDRVEGLDDYNRVTDSLSEYSEEASGAKGAPVLTYDERRRLNREEYNRQFVDKLRRSSEQAQHIPDESVKEFPPLPPSPPPYSASKSSHTGKINKYGDIVYE